MIRLKLSAWKAWSIYHIRRVPHCCFETDGNVENPAVGDEIMRVDFVSYDNCGAYATACAFVVIESFLKERIGWGKGVRLVHDLENRRVSAFADDGNYYNITAHEVLLPGSNGVAYSVPDSPSLCDGSKGR